MQIRDGSVLPYCAVRYALCTHSGIAHTVISEITPMLTKLQDSDLETISISIAEHMDECKERGAWSIDDTDWKRFREAVERERKRRDVNIGIDPGKNGGLAWIKDSGKAEAERLNIETLASRLRVITGNGSIPAKCYVEKVHSMPKQGVASTFSFGTNYGFILGVLTAVGVKYELVQPSVWKKAMDVTADKRTSIKRCKELFPDVDLKATARCKKDHDGMAEALLIAEYGRTQCGY